MTLRSLELRSRPLPPVGTDSLPASVYRFIWHATARPQLVLCLLTAAVVGLAPVPLELQRRMVEGAIGDRDLVLLAWLAAAYLLVILFAGAVKYALNVLRGRVVELANRRLRLIVHRRADGNPDRATAPSGTVVSMMASEVEDIGGFAGEAISTPLQHVGTALAIFGYLLWVEPLIAALAVLLYMPLLVGTPLLQRAVNAYARTHAKIIRLIGERVVREQAAGPAEASDEPGFQRLVDTAFHLRIRNYFFRYGQTWLSNFLDALAPVLVLGVGGWLVVAGETELATLVVFISGLQRLAEPLAEIVTFYRTASTARVKYRLIRSRTDAFAPAA